MDPAQYFKRMKQRDTELAKLVQKRGGTICTTPYAGSGNYRRPAENVLLELGRPVISSKNYLRQSEDKRLLKK